MSTSDEVYANYYYYVACYIVAQQATTPQSVAAQIYNQTIGYYFSGNEDGSDTIYYWNVPSISEPALSDLEAITPATVTDYILTEKITLINLEYPDMGIIVLDLYNQINLLQGGAGYTYTTLLAYLKTILH